MKKIIPFIFCFATLLSFLGCKKDKYPGGVLSDYISLLDLRNIYNDAPITLTKETMFGATKISGLVVSDHRGGNAPAGLVMMQDNRRLGIMRGIAIEIGADAADYLPGDSIEINLVGKTMVREAGILKLKSITNTEVTKLNSGNALTIPLVKSNLIIDRPGDYESTLLTITRVGFDASYPAGTTYAGDKIINDGFGNMTLHTEPTVSYANDPVPFLSNFTGVIYTPQTDTVPQLWPRSEDDITILAATAPKIAPLVITGYLADVGGSSVADANYEYIQLMATKNIDFSVNNFSVVTTNNAGANTPTGFPPSGWATGGLRTYKINLTSGTINKGQYLYIGANKNIYGPGSTDISSAKWITKMYSSVAGDGFGNATNNLLANSGNAAGIAIFDLTNVTVDTIPVDVIFYGGSGNIYTAGPPERGYKITNTDYYDVKNPSTLAIQPYFNMGSNTGKLAFAGANFSSLGGRYNIITGRWTSARTLTGVTLTTSSALTDIEGTTTIEE